MWADTKINGYDLNYLETVCNMSEPLDVKTFYSVI